MRCLYREVICRAGDYVDIDVYPVFGKAKTRKAKYRPTSDQQERINRRNAKLKMTRLLNANFTKTDLLVTLTYRQECLPENDEETVKVMKNFFRRLKRRMKAAGAELKYVCVTERSSTRRYHHHLIVNGGVSAREIGDCWTNGIVQVSPLEFDYDDGIRCLAQYLSKGMTAGYKSFSYSRNLKKPEFSERTGRLSKKAVKELLTLTDCPSEFEKLYPGYEYRAAEGIWDPENKYYYMRIKMKGRKINERKGVSRIYASQRQESENIQPS